MDITALPRDCFDYIGQYLTIDDRISLYRAFPKRPRPHNTRLKAIGIRNVIHRTPICEKLIARYDLVERWNCADPEHAAVDVLTSSDSLMKLCHRCKEYAIICLLKQHTNIESLDLRGIHINLQLISKIYYFCPNLHCLKLNFILIDLDALKFFTDFICPQIKHLSCDNLFLIYTRESFIKNLTSLEQLEFTSFSLNHIHCILQAISIESLKFLSLKLFGEGKKRTRNSHLCVFTETINSAQLSLNNILYLKVKTNFDYRMNYELTKALTKFENVRAINLNYMNFSHPNLVFKFDCWPQLESLTVDFYDLVNSNDLLVKFLNGPYIRNLRSLRIMSIAISRNSILKLCENCKNLQRLQFVDVTFKSFNYVFECLLLLKNLEELHIEYTFKELLPDYEYLSNIVQMKKKLEFPSQDLPTLKKFVDTHPNLSKLSLIDWPGLNQAILAEIRQVAFQKQIDIYSCLSN